MIRLSLICGGLLLLLVGGVLAAGRPADGAIEWILFISHGRDAGPGLYRMPPAGGDPELLYAGEFGGIRPTPQDDDTVVVTIWDEAILRLNPLTGAPQGRLELAVLALPDDRVRLHSVAPDGSWYLLAGLSDYQSGRGYLAARLYRVRPDGSDLTPLPLDALSGTPPISWAADSGTLWLAAWRQADDSRVLAAYDIAAGTLTPLDVDLTGVYSPTVSPDGRWLAYSRSEGEMIEEMVHFVEVMPLDGGDPHTLYTGPGAPITLAWSPDGGWLLLSTFESGCDIHTIERASGARHTVGWVDCYHHALPAPRWSADGAWVLFADTFAVTHIHRAPRDGSRPAATLTGGEVLDSSPVAVRWAGFDWSAASALGVGLALVAAGVGLHAFRRVS